MQVFPVACLRDNYAYLVRQDGGRDAVVVDPSEAGPVFSALDEKQLRLVGILNTHHHHDHVGGNQELTARLGQMPVFGHVSDRGRIPAQSHFVDQGEQIEVAGLQFDILHIPGHTMGAVAYVGDGCVFTGDTLFAAGCGRLFEGSPKDMYVSLNEKLGALPEGTEVYFGHEYTAKNLAFAAELEPSNEAIRHKLEQVSKLREEGQPTLPSTLAEEHKTNPFMRCEAPELIKNLQGRLGEDRSPIAVLAAARAAKDAF